MLVLDLLKKIHTSMILVLGLFSKFHTSLVQRLWSILAQDILSEGVYYCWLQPSWAYWLAVYFLCSCCNILAVWTLTSCLILTGYGWFKCVRWRNAWISFFCFLLIIFTFMISWCNLVVAQAEILTTLISAILYILLDAKLWRSSPGFN